MKTIYILYLTSYHKRYVEAIKKYGLSLQQRKPITYMSWLLS